MLGDVEGITAACAEMEADAKAGTDIKAASDKVSAMLDELVRKFDAREQILNTV
jgi:hypothetical protein